MNNKRRSVIINAVTELENALEHLKFKIELFKKVTVDKLNEALENEQIAIDRVPESMSEKSSDMQDTLDEITSLVEDLHTDMEELESNICQAESTLSNLRECAERRR